MSTKATLKALRKSQFPLRFEEYSRIHDKLAQAADGFAELGYDDLAKELDAVRGRLGQAWDAIAAAEREGR